MLESSFMSEQTKRVKYVLRETQSIGTRFHYQSSAIVLLSCQCVKCALLHSVTHHHITDILIYTIIYNTYTILCHTIHTVYTIPAHTVIYDTVQCIYTYILIRSYTLMLPHHIICYYSIKTYTSYLYIRHLLPCLISCLSYIQ